MRIAPRVLAFLLALACASACDGRAQAGTPSARALRELPALPDSAWAALVLGLSEEGGYFDTDNLISNESSYLHALGPLRELRGGAYLGVGPDQSFSYAAALRPAVVFVIDIRRDNVLQHLLFRALFALSRNRAEYLARLHGRALPEDPRAWDDRPLEDILDRVDSLRVDPAAVRATREAVDSLLRALPLPLGADDLATVQRFHREFVEEGTSLRFRTFGRAPNPGYPTYRRLLLETDLEGRQGSFMAREADFQWVRRLQARNLVIPVVGDLAGAHALRAIGAWLEEREVGVSAFYTSNVEDYLWRGGGFPAFVENVRALPWTRGGRIVRSWFPGPLGPHPDNVPGYYSTQLVQPVAAFLEAADAAAAGRVRSYFDVVSAGAEPARR